MLLKGLQGILRPFNHQHYGRPQIDSVTFVPDRAEALNILASGF